MARVLPYNLGLGQDAAEAFKGQGALHLLDVQRTFFAGKASGLVQHAAYTIHGMQHLGSEDVCPKHLADP